MQNFLHVFFLFFLFYFCCRPTILRVFLYKDLQTELLTHPKKEKKKLFSAVGRKQRNCGKTVIKH